MGDVRGQDDGHAIVDVGEGKARDRLGGSDLVGRGRGGREEGRGGRKEGKMKRRRRKEGRERRRKGKGRKMLKE